MSYALMISAAMHSYNDNPRLPGEDSRLVNNFYFSREETPLGAV